MFEFTKGSVSNQNEGGFPEKGCFRFHSIAIAWEQDRDDVVVGMETTLERVKKIIDYSPAILNILCC